MAEPHLDDSLGAIELGIVFSTALYGVVFVQCYTYYQAGFKDSVYLKALVSAFDPGLIQAFLHLTISEDCFRAVSFAVLESIALLLSSNLDQSS